MHECSGTKGVIQALALTPSLSLLYTYTQQAQSQYLLSTREYEAIPSVSYVEVGYTGPFSSITLVVRAHAERLATECYPNGLLGLEADREERKQKARDGRAKVLENYEKRKAEAAKVGMSAVRPHLTKHPLTLLPFPSRTHSHTGWQAGAQSPQGVPHPAE